MSLPLFSVLRTARIPFRISYSPVETSHIPTVCSNQYRHNAHPNLPLLFTLALSSSTLAYPTPKERVDSPNPNHEKSLVLGGGGGDEGGSWGIRPDRMPGKLGGRWSEFPSLFFKPLKSCIH